MATFDEAINLVLANEGGLSNDAHDAGGITKYGISYRFLSKVQPNCTADTIKNLTLDAAKRLYHDNFWQAYGFAAIESQVLANYLFDFTVNTGIGAAIRAVQRATWAMDIANFNRVKDDGILGKDTLHYLNRYGETLMPALRAERASYYRLIALNSIDQTKFLKGWLARAYGH